MPRSGAGVTAVDAHGCTPLHLAVTGGAYSNQVGAAEVSDAVDLLFRWGADESATNSIFGPHLPGTTVADEWRRTVLRSQISNADETSVLKLLERAQQDKAWRRRGWLVLCRIFPDRVRLKVDDGEACTGLARSVRARGVGAESVSADAPAAGEAETGAAGTAPCTIPTGGLGLLVARVVGLHEEGVFRNILEFV